MAYEIIRNDFDETAYDYARARWPEKTMSKIDNGYVSEYFRKNPRVMRHLTENEPEGYYRELEPVDNVLSFRDLWVRYSDRFMKAEIERKKKTEKLERRRFCRADCCAGRVEDEGYYTTLAAIARRAGEGYNYLKNLRSKSCTVNPSRDRVVRLAKAIDATPNELNLLLRTAGHAA